MAPFASLPWILLVRHSLEVFNEWDGPRYDDRDRALATLIAAGCIAEVVVGIAVGFWEPVHWFWQLLGGRS